MPLISAQDAVDDLYRIAVAEGKKTSTARLDALAAFWEPQRRSLRRRVTGGTAVDAPRDGVRCAAALCDARHECLHTDKAW